MAVTTATVLGIAAMGTAAVGTGMAYYGQKQQAKTAGAVGEYNARTGEYNAKLAEASALQVELDGRENIRRKRVENQRFQSTQRSRFAKAGVTEEGTPLEVMSETASFLEMDALEINRQAQIRAAQLRAQGQQHQVGSMFDRAAGQAEASAHRMGATMTLLNGASNMAGTAYGLKKSGAF